MAEPTAAPGTVLEPYRAYNFKLAIQGIAEGHFTECSGLDVKVTPISYRQGGVSQVVHRLPGPVEYGDITLRYGLTSSKQLWDWFLGAVRGEVVRQNVSILLLGSDGSDPVTQWDLVNAWPSRWRGAPLDAMCKEVAIESMTLVFESLERA